MAGSSCAPLSVRCPSTLSAPATDCVDQAAGCLEVLGLGEKEVTDFCMWVHVYILMGRLYCLQMHWVIANLRPRTLGALLYYYLVNLWSIHPFLSNNIRQLPLHRTGNEHMQLSAIYPMGFGRALGQVMLWLVDGACHGNISAFAERISQERPTPEQPLQEARNAAAAINWQDRDPGFAQAESLCVQKPSKALVRQALKKRKAQLESKKKPSFSDEEEAAVVHDGHAENRHGLSPEALM